MFEVMTSNIDWARARVPISVRCPRGTNTPEPAPTIDLVVANLNAQGPFERVPGLVIAVVEMPWGYQARWSCRATGITPSATTKALAMEPRMFPESRGAIIDGLISTGTLYIFY